MTDPEFIENLEYLNEHPSKTLARLKKLFIKKHGKVKWALTMNRMFKDDCTRHV